MILAAQTLPVAVGRADWGAVLPEVVTAAGVLLMLILDVTPIPRKRVVLSSVALGIVVLAAGAALLLWFNGANVAMYYTVTSDKFAVYFDWVILLSAALAILMSADYVERSTFDPGEYYALVLAATTGMMLMAAAISFMVIFIALELLSLALYILSGFERGRERSQESGFKYFLLSSFASAFLIYGMALVYGATGSTQLHAIAACLQRANVLQGIPGSAACVSGAAANSPLLYVGIALMAVGYAFKVSVIPFHMWTPDVYQGAPTPITAFMSVATKAAAFASFIRVFNLTLGSVESHWFGILWVLAILTMIGGNVVALAQTSMKRMLAYSGIAHAGYILVAMAANNSQGLSAVAFYFLAYSFMNIGAFILVSVLESRGEAGDEISSYRGLISRNPGLAWSTAAFMFSLAGFPPTAGFMAKYFAFQAIVQAGHTELAIIGVLTSLISIYYYLRVVFVIFTPEAAAEKRSLFVIPGFSDLALYAAVAGTIGLGILPTGFFNLATQAVDGVRTAFGQ